MFLGVFDRVGVGGDGERLGAEQAAQFRTNGAIGSHLENLERNAGFNRFLGTQGLRFRASVQPGANDLGMLVRAYCGGVIVPAEIRELLNPTRLSLHSLQSLIDNFPVESVKEEARKKLQMVIEKELEIENQQKADTVEEKN